MGSKFKFAQFCIWIVNVSDTINVFPFSNLDALENWCILYIYKLLVYIYYTCK
jgi:hypothetical protein